MWDGGMGSVQNYYRNLHINQPRIAEQKYVSDTGDHLE